MKKLLLSLGAVAAVVAPVTAVVACSNDSTTKADYAFTSEDLTKNFSKTPGVIDATAKDIQAKLKTGGVDKITFTLDAGKVLTFDFGTDKFFHNGIQDATKVEIKGSNSDPETGEYADYISSQSALKIDGGKLMLKGGATKGELDAIKYVLRMAVASKTDLHLDNS